MYSLREESRERCVVRDQRLIGNALAIDLAEQRINKIHRVNANITLIETVGKFINLALQVFLAELVIHAAEPAIEDDQFDNIGIEGTERRSAFGRDMPVAERVF